jgi:hypothetical protein
MSAREWFALEDGDEVPDKYVFENECPEAMPILIKGGGK